MATPSSGSEILRFGIFEADPLAGELRKNGVRVKLQQQPFQVLVCLLEHSGKVVTREDLIGILWPNGTVVEYEHSLGTAVNKIRQSLGDTADNPRFVETLPRRGYRFLVPVERIARPSVELPRQVAEPPPRPGGTISRYKILAKLGEGGMGVVYKAEDTRLHRTVALKFLPRQAITDAEKKRFLREAQVVALLSHPNICPIYDVDQVGGQVFFVMAFLEGQSLVDLVSPGPVDIAQAIDIAIQIARGLEEAHEHDVVHRDIKPNNIIVSEKGHVRILDFGLALVVGQSRLTKTGSALGTAGYMSPEQAQGQPVDLRTDIWSLGVVLYEMVTGQLPFQADYELATMYGIVNEPPTPIRQLRPDAPPELQRALDRALAKRPEDRYSSVAELMLDLRHLEASLKRQSAAPRDAVGEIVKELPEPTEDRPQPPKEAKPAVARRPSGLQRLLRRLSVGWLVAGLSVVLVIVGLTFWTASIQESRIPGSSGLPEEKHVAVLPFETFGDDPAVQALADGLVEVLTSKLTQLEQFEGELSVVPASEIRDSKITSVEEARREYEVTLVITGSVQHWGDQMQLTANLVDARKVRQLGATTLDFGLGNLASLREGVISRVVRLLEPDLTPGAEEKLYAGDSSQPRAYQAYLEGRGYMQRFDVEGNLERAVRSFESAIQQDENYALAYAGLGEAYWEKAQKTNDREWITRALESAKRAVQLNDRLTTTHVQLGAIYYRLDRLEDAIREFERALVLDPTSAAAHRGLARVHESAGRWGDAEASYLKAIGLRPTDWQGFMMLGTFYFSQGRFSEAASAWETASELTPDNDINYKNLGAAYLMLGEYEDAKIALQKSLDIEPSARAYRNLAHLALFEGRYHDAVSAARMAIDLRGNLYRPWAFLADAYRRIPGNEAKAEQALRRAIEIGQQTLAIEPNFYTLRARVAQYWAKLGEPEKALQQLRQIPAPDKRSAETQLEIAMVFELIGERKRALEVIESLLQEGFPPKPIQNDPTFAELQKDPSFQEMIARPR